MFVLIKLFTKIANPITLIIIILLSCPLLPGMFFLEHSRHIQGNLPPQGPGCLKYSPVFTMEVDGVCTLGSGFSGALCGDFCSGEESLEKSGERLLVREWQC